MQTARPSHQSIWLQICLLVSILLPLASKAQYYLMTHDAVLPYVKNTLLKEHASPNPNATAKQIAVAGQHLMQPDPLPLEQSATYGSALAASRAAYAQGQFNKAATQLTAGLASETQNPFLLFQYARALYATEVRKPESFVVYQQLIRSLDRDNGENDSTATIDYWFLRHTGSLAPCRWTKRNGARQPTISPAFWPEQLRWMSSRRSPCFTSKR